MKQKKRNNTHSRPVPHLVAWLMFPLVAAMLLFAPGNAAAQIWSPTWDYSNFEEAVQVTDNSAALSEETEWNSYVSSNTDDANSFTYYADNQNGNGGNVNLNCVFSEKITNFSAGNYVLKFDLSTYVENFNDAKLTFTLISEDLSTPIATLGEFPLEGPYGGSQKVEFQLEKDLSGSAYLCMTFSGTLYDDSYSCTFANFQMYEGFTINYASDGGMIFEQNGNETAKGGDEVTISIIPDNGNYFNSIKVTDSKGDPVAVRCNGFSAEYTTATFTMPYSNVTITAVFATDVTIENGAFLTLPYGKLNDNFEYISVDPDTRTLDFYNDLNIKSFYVYDDGGEFGDYSDYCNGAIEITAPDDKLIRVTGTSEFANDYCNLDIFEGPSYMYTPIYTSNVSDGKINGLSSSYKMRIGFQSNDENYDHQSGLSLRVDILDNEAHNITVVPITGGTAICNNGNQAKFKDDVTIQVEPAEGYYFGGIIVKEQESEKPIIVSNIDWEQNTATFAMPYADVTVTPIFVSELSVEGGLSFNMPASSAVNPMFTLSEDVLSFKIYDDGGENGTYSANSYGSIAIYAPKGKLIQVSGSINSTPDKGILTIYDKIYNDQSLLYYGSGVELIAPIISSDNTMELFFDASYDKDPGDGLDLTVALIDNKAHNITLSADGGTISAENDKPSANVGDVISLTTGPDADHHLMGIDVITADNKSVAVIGGDFDNTNAKFTMPFADVNVTATFATEISTDNGARVCLPKSDEREIQLSEKVKSFHLYDDGGKDGNYSSGCTSTLTLTAPEGKLIQITGSTAINKNDYLYVYDGDANGECLYSNYGTPDEINVISKQLQVLFTTSKSNNPKSGIDWIVSVVENKAHNIIVKAEPAGTVAVDGNQTTATQNDVIKLTATPADGYYLAGIEVADEDGNPISVTGGVWYDSDASFTMPYSDVTITPKFVSEITANGDYYINMPSIGDIELDLTNKPGVKSFRLFDDGGENSFYSGQCNGTLTIKIPESASIEISGTMDAGDRTQLTIGDDDSPSEYNYSAYVNYSSDNNTTTINFYTEEDSPWFSGLDLTVTIVRKHSITLVQPEIGGTAFCELEDPTAVAEGEHVTICAKTQNGYYLVGLNVIDENGGKIYVNNVDWNYSKATFAMPAASVTVTPIFSKEVTTDYGASITMVSNAYDRTIDLSNKPEVKSFYIYDDGGQGDENPASSSLTITAPEGKVIKVTGSIDKTSSSADNLTLNDNMYHDVVDYTSEDNTLTIVFNGSYGVNGDEGFTRLDLTVTIIPLHSITVNNPTEGGTAQSNKTVAKEDEEITITATPAEGYYFIGIDVKDADGNLITTTGGDWLSNNNTATFSMPSTDVTVTPKFVTEITAEAGAYINMPSHDEMEISLSAAVKSFHLYDDGGKDGNYSNDTYGFLAITAPEGTLIHIEGSFDLYYNDYFTVEDQLTHLKKRYEGSSNISITSSNNIKIEFFDDELTGTNPGLDLVVSVVENVAHEIEIASVEGGTVTANENEAKANEEITITAAPAAGHYLLSIDVTDENGKSITVTGGDFLNNTATFTMPYANVTVTPKFITEITAEAGAYINMPRGIVKYTEAGYVESVENETREINLTSAVKSFHLYDDGGKDGNYSNQSNGSLAITAPDGTVIQVTGSIETKYNIDYLNIYDGLSESGNKLYNNSGEDNNISITSSGNTMQIKFTSNNGTQKSGLDLVVSIFTPIMTITEDEEGVKTATFHGTSSQTLEIKTAIKVDQVVYDRKFTPGKPSTVMLPFNYTCNGNEGGKFYEFAGVTKDDNGIWTAVMQEPGDNDANETTLKANTPYIFKPSAETMQFPNTPEGGFRLCTTVDGGSGSKVSDWQFIGTYSAMTWTVTTGKDYGFAAKAGTGKDKDGNDVTVAQGEFVQLTEGAFSKPMRAYLRNIHDEGISKAATELPSTIEVIFIDRTAKAADEPNDNPNTEDISGNDGDITTPVSEINPGNAAKAWSYEKTIFIEGNAGSAYRIIDVSGRILRTDVLRTTRDEISLGAHTSGIVVVIINGKTFKLNY